MASGGKAELIAAIRRDARKGMSGRALALKYGVHRRTVAQALTSAWPRPRKPLPPRPSRLDPYKPLIEQMLRVDLDAPPKQRHPVVRMWNRLLEEHGADDISYPMVRDYVRQRRAEIRSEEGRGPPAVFIEQTHQPGAEAEVDFGDAWVNLAGQLTRCYLFAFRLSWSGKAVHRIFLTCSQEAFFEGHVHALSVLGGAPTGMVRYDNLRPAVAKVLGFHPWPGGKREVGGFPQPLNPCCREFPEPHVHHGGAGCRFVLGAVLDSGSSMNLRSSLRIPELSLWKPMLVVDFRAGRR